MSSLLDLYKVCQSRIPKQTIEEYAKLLIEQDHTILDQWKSQLLQLLKDKQSEITITCQMNILFILNKVILDYSSQYTTELFQEIIEFLIHNVYRYGEDSKELQHILKLIKTWISVQKFPKEWLLTWRKAIEEEVTSREAHKPPPPPPPPSSSSAPDSSSKHRKRARSDPNLQNLLETLSATPGESAAGTMNFSSAQAQREWLQFDFDESSSSSLYFPRREVNEFVLQMLPGMCKFIKQIFDYLCSVSQSSQEVSHWKTIMSTSFWLLHNFMEMMEVSDDNIAVSLACIYLSGKAEHFFIKTDKLRTLSQKFVTDCFGRDSLLPGDSTIFYYEMKLLHIISFDINNIQNPYKQLRLWKDENKFPEGANFARYVEVLEQDAILFQSRYWYYHANSFVIFLMLIKEGRSNVEEYVREHLKKILKRYIPSNPSTNLMEVFELLQIAQYYEISPISDKTFFYNTLAYFFKKMFGLNFTILPSLQIPCPPTDHSDGSSASLLNIAENNLKTPAAAAAAAAVVVETVSSQNASPVFNNEPVSTPASSTNVGILEDNMIAALNEFKSLPSSAMNTPMQVKSTPHDSERYSENGSSSELNSNRQEEQVSMTKLSEGIAFAYLNSPANNNHNNPDISRRTTITSLTEQFQENSIAEDDGMLPPPPPPPEDSDSEVAALPMTPPPPPPPEDDILSPASDRMPHGSELLNSRQSLSPSVVVNGFLSPQNPGLDLLIPKEELEVVNKDQLVHRNESSLINSDQNNGNILQNTAKQEQPAPRLTRSKSKDDSARDDKLQGIINLKFRRNVFKQEESLLAKRKSEVDNTPVTESNEGQDKIHNDDNRSPKRFRTD